jgi:hypothetical protein
MPSTIIRPRVRPLPVTGEDGFTYLPLAQVDERPIVDENVPPHAFETDAYAPLSVDQAQYA